MDDPGVAHRFEDELFARWLPGAMFPTEVLWLERAVRRAAVDLVIECGRQDGVSTWVLGTLLRGSGTEILSIDFDDDAGRLAKTRQLLADLPVTCVSGDIHVQVPTLLRERRGRRIAVVQDGPKGWEGLATLLAAAHEPDVVLIAQHNLQRGHVTRTVFEMLSLDPCFPETALAGDTEFERLRAREVDELARRTPNRPLDHTSLGVIELDDERRRHLVAAIDVIGRRFAPWDPRRVRAHWDRGDLAYCSRLRSRARFTPARSKRR